MASLLLEAGVILAVLAVAGTVAARVDVSVIPLYVVAGMVVGPAVLGRAGYPAIEDQAFITLLAELGIVFLLFFLGLEFSLERLLEATDRIGASGAIDLVVNFPVGVAVGLAVGWTPLEAVVLGGIVYISSSAVITKSLIDLGWIANDEARPMLGTLVFEDLFIALYLAVVSALLLGSGGLTAVAVDVGIAVAVLCVLLLAVARGDRLFQRYLEVDSQELFVIRAVAVPVLVAGVALALGVSEAVAAFFVGMGFSGTEHRHSLETRLTPLRDVFAAVFFLWIGLTTDPAVFADVAVAGLVVVLVVLSTPTKVLSGFLAGRVYGLSDRRSLRVGLGMVTRGEFSLIIAALAAGAGGSVVLRETIPAVAVGYVLVMSIIGTLLMQYAGVFERVLENRSPSPSGE